MCGIVGFLNRASGYELEPTVRRMADTIYHRGPDKGGWLVEVSA
jgi:asparagine synthetase B (glutamine-hydrolysing)